MTEEEVVQAEVLETEHERMGPRLSTGPIIAIIVVFLILTSLGIYFFYGGDTVSVIVDPQGIVYDRDSDTYNLEILVVTETNGFRRVDHEGVMTVLGGEGMTKELYRLKASVSNDATHVYIPIHAFVEANGLYNFVFEADGVKGNETYLIEFVPEKLSFTLGRIEDPDTGMFRMFVKVMPRIPYAPLNLDLDKKYTVTCTIEDPLYNSVTEKRTLYDLFVEDPMNRTYPNIYPETPYMGNYTVTMSLSNDLVKDSSPHRTIEGEPDEFVKEGWIEGNRATLFINQRPHITSARILDSDPKVDQTIRFEARGRDPDGEISFFQVTWERDGDPESADILRYEAVSNGVDIEHIFKDPGTYICSFKAFDNGFEIDEVDYRESSEPEVIEVYVRKPFFP